ncbi:MAG: tetratricopeptide repeat protein [Bacteroidota bacterium]
MRRVRKVFSYVTGGTIGFAVIVLLVKFIFDNHFRTQIPPPPDMQSISIRLKEQMSDAFKNANHKPTADNIGTLGMVYHSSANYDKASMCYKLAEKKNKKEWIWSYYLGYLNQEMGDPNAAIGNFMNVTKKNPQAYLAWYYAGECYQKIGSYDSAELAFKYIITRLGKNVIVKTAKRYDYFPMVAYSMYDLARIYVDTRQFDLAEKTLREIIDYQRAFGPAYRLLGNVYSIKGSDSLSNRYLVRANDLAGNPSPVDTLIDKLSLMSRSDMYLLKRIDEAEKNVFPEYALELVNHALTYIPDNNYLISKAIKLFLIRDIGKQALPYLDQHSNYFQKDYNELKSVGDLLYKKGFYSEGMNYFSKAIKLKPSDNQAQSCIIICLSKVGRKKEALDLINALLEKNETNPEIITDGMALLLNIGEKEKAMIWLARLKSLSSSYPKGLQLEGMLDEQEGKWQKALPLYYSAFKGDPEDLTTIQLLGNLLLRQKMWDKAILHFTKALEYHPNEPFLLERLGTLLVTCNDLKFRNITEGKDLCERAFIHTASHSITLISAGRSLAIAYAALGDNRNARNILKMTMNLARNENFSSEYIANLEKLMEQFSLQN